MTDRPDRALNPPKLPAGPAADTPAPRAWSSAPLQLELFPDERATPAGPALAPRGAPTTTSPTTSPSTTATRRTMPAPAGPAAPDAPALGRHPRRGHPGHRLRNDHLLALYLTTPEQLPHLQRCRIAARMLADEQADLAHMARPLMPAMADTTARDAIAEALAHRAALDGQTPATAVDPDTPAP